MLHVRKLSAGLLLVTAGILATTASTGTVAQAPQRAAPIVPVAAPTFFFDDDADALGDTFTGIATAMIDEAATTSAATELSSSTSVPPLDPPAANERATNGQPARSALSALLVGAGVATPPLAAVSLPPALAAVRARAEVPSGARESVVVVGTGDTLSGILNDHGVRIEQMATLLDDEVVERHLSNLRIGQKFNITRLPDGSFHSLSVKVGKDRRVTIRRTEDDFAVAAIDLPVEKERVVTSGTIEQSLYLAAEQADLKQSTIMTLADIFQWELDFARDIRRGDHFAVVYDRLYREGEYIGDGDILAAEFERGGRTYRAIRFTAEDGTSGYYAPDGSSKRRTFLRHPVDVVRITSKFDPERLHPVLHQIRAHRGVDYGSPHGSPIYATADGVVGFSGVRGAYGNTVVLRHGERTETLYAHMSRISDKSTVGKRVRQGDVIGYVGRTGRVTGTHLHYEFRVGGKHVDPLTVELPAAAPLAAEWRDALRVRSEELIAQMRSVLPDESSEDVAAGTTARGASDG